MPPQEQGRSQSLESFLSTAFQARLSRRDALRLGAFAGTAALLQACGLGEASGGEREVPTLISQRLRTFRDYYIDPAGVNHYKVEVEDASNPYQCIDGIKAYAKGAGFPTDTLTHGSAKDMLTPTRTTEGWLNIVRLNKGQIPSIFPPEGAVVAYGAGIGNKDGHVGVSLGTGRREGGDMFVDVISQNYITQSMEIDSISSQNGELLGWLYPKKLDPAGQLPERELAFVTEGNQTQEPEGELTVEQQAYRAAADNFFSYLALGNYNRPWSFIDNPYDIYVESSLVIPGGITKDELVARLARGEKFSLGEPVIYDWISYFTGNNGRGPRNITRGRIHFDNLFVDNTQYFTGIADQVFNDPVSPTEERSGTLFHGNLFVHAQVQYSGIHGYSDVDMDRFLQRAREAELPAPQGWEDLQYRMYTILTSGGANTFPDLVAGKDRAYTSQNEYVLPVDPNFLEVAHLRREAFDNFYDS